MTTIGDGIKKAQASSVTNPFSDASSELSAMKTGVRGVADNRSFGGITLHVSQQISVGGDGNTREQAREGARQGAADLMRDLRDAMNKERRLSFG